jgi:hypothetical protein
MVGFHSSGVTCDAGIISEYTESSKKNATVLNYCIYVNYYQDYDDYIFQQDGAPPHFHREVREILNDVFPQR